MYLKRILGILSIAIALFVHAFSIARAEINNRTFDFTKKSLTLNDGLCSDEVKQIYKDKDGFIWIATKNGLSSYDGHSFTTFKSNLHNWNLLSNNDVTYLIDGEDNLLWIGTTEGLNVLDKTTGIFRQINDPIFKNNPIAQILPLDNGNIMIATDRGLVIYYHEKDSCTTITRERTGNIMPQTAIKSLLEDKKGNIWIGTWNEGLFRYDPKTNKYISYPKMNNRNSAHYLFEDSSGSIWIGTWGHGLQKLKNPYDLNKLSWETYANIPGNDKTLINNTIYTIAEDSLSHSIWVGTPAGMSILDKNSGEILTNFYPDKGFNSISGGEVNSILAEDNGSIWIGMLGSGINIFNFTPPQDFYTNSLNDIQDRLQSNSVRSILIDSSNKMWLGIGTQHLVQIDMETGQWKCDKGIPGFENIPGYTVMAITQSRSTGKIWIGTYDGGLLAYDPENHKVDMYKQEDTQWIPGNRIYAITEDHNDQLWIGTQYGFGMYSPSGGSYAKFYNIKAGNININEITVNSIIEDKNGILWIGTRTSGIIRLEGEGGDASKYSIKTYTPENGGLNAINAISLLIDSKNRMWVGTQGGGLSLYDPQKDIFVPKHAKWELPGDDIYSILADKKDNLWMATNNGLVNLIFTDDVNAKPIYRLYTVANGLQSNIFNANVMFKKADGEMFFGGHHGYNSFYPEEIKTADFNAPIAITDILIHGKSWMTLDADDRAKISSKTPNATNEITLNYKQNNFSIEFAALDYKSPEQNRYSYMLKGYSNDWRYVDEKHRYAQYNNLEPGTYEFLLRATNSSGKWVDRPQTLKIKILPPPWLSWWAYSIYAILLIALCILGYRFAKKKIRLYNERELEKFISDKAEEMNHAKLQFFTNITHELLTPLTIISASIEELKANAPQYKDTYKAMLVNTNRLIRLIQQILEFRKAETGNLKLKVSQGDLAAFVRNCTNSFKPLMKKKDIHFSVECDPEPLHAYFDTDKIDKILYNLLSNASKYNKEGGHVWITLSLSTNKKNAILSVKDDGEGMTAEAQKTLFQRFYEGDYRKYNTTGTGIGLSLAKDLVELHQGSIEGHSEPGKGMEFVIKFPINRDAYSEDCIDDARDQLPIVQREIIVEDFNDKIEDNNTVAATTPQQKEPQKESKRHAKEYTLLLVEDNNELLQVMARLLSLEYNIMTAHNGKEATEIITNNDIQLIISDIMMPDTDGLQFCKYIKSHLETSHIPVILLTAKDREEDRIEAYQSGADAYIKKPFNLSLLQARITNLLKTHERANKDFKKQLVFDVNELNYTSIDEEFLKKAISIVQEHLSDPDYDQSRFVEDMGTSKSTLFRKLKSLTGLSYSSFVRNIRIKAACQIMEEKRHIRISELAYAIGFNDPKYFSACFKKEFGIHPSEYMKRFVDDSGEITDDTEEEYEENDKPSNSDPEKE